jgi:sugar/nucleoside kinase (ribokinase family)
VLGGAGSYTAVGARLFCGSSPGAVGWIVDCGSDFPPAVRAAIEGWRTSCLLRETPERLTTRARNDYGANDFRGSFACAHLRGNFDAAKGFRYLTPKKQLTADDLTPALLRARCFHLICSPDRLVATVTRLRERLAADGIAPPPMIIWEPVPDLCVPEQAAALRAALPLVDVVSPNHREQAGFFGRTGESARDGGGSVDREDVARHSREMLAAGARAVVVRCGREGCYVAHGEGSAWVPAYHGGAEAVVDPTGAGNAFLGGLAVALARGRGWVEAAAWGSVAASFAVEQIGLPARGEGADGAERWNGVGTGERLEQFLGRLRSEGVLGERGPVGDAFAS